MLPLIVVASVGCAWLLVTFLGMKKLVQENVLGWNSIQIFV